MPLALDAPLSNTVCIDPQRVRNTLERATMLHSLYITTEVADWDIIASALTVFRLLKCFAIPGSGLLHCAMPGILEHCESLTTVVLLGWYRLAAFGVQTLESLSSLKKLVNSDHLQTHVGPLYQQCCSCHRLECLELNLQQISRSKRWTFVKGLVHLRHLSVSVIATAGLVQVSKTCPGLSTLKLHSCGTKTSAWPRLFRASCNSSRCTLSTVADNFC